MADESDALRTAYEKKNRWGVHLGIEYLEMTPERARGRVVIDERHHQPYGIAHGGVYASIVEDIASNAAGEVARARGQAGIVGVSNQTDFLRSHGEGELVCEATPLFVGRRQHVWEVVIHRTSDQKLVSRGQVRFQVLDQLPHERKG